MAVLFIKKIGFQIFELNCRHKDLEVDMIAHDNDVVVFVEVEVRSSSALVPPQELISPRKRKG